MRQKYSKSYYSFLFFFNQRIYCSRLDLTKRKSFLKKIELPCNFSRSDLFWSTSGLSAFNTWFKHWLCRLLRVTVKFTNVTRLHKSGANSTCSYTKGYLKVKKKKPRRSILHGDCEFIPVSHALDKTKKPNFFNINKVSNYVIQSK